MQKIIASPSDPLEHEPQHHRQLPGRKGTRCIWAAGPPVEAPLRESLHTEPKSLTVIEQDVQRRARAITEYIDRSFQGIGPQCSATDSGEAIDAFAKSHWFDGQKDAGLRG